MAAPAPAPPNAFGLHQYDGLSSFFGDQTFDYGAFILPPAAGWIVVILFGFLFALLAVALVWIDIKFAGAIYNSEQFNTAGRSIGMGLLAVDIVSHWTWASIILQSVSYGYFFGSTGAFWYAANGAGIVLAFGVVANELKYKAPKAHTMLELVYVRWGPVAHIIYFLFAVLTNLLVSLSMLQGCVSAINALTGVSVYAMSFLIPIGVVIYAAIGGLKATFTTSYMHTVIIFVLCLIFMFKVYVPGDLLGGIDDVYNRLQTMATVIPAADQLDGSYLTGWSSAGLQFFVIIFLSSCAQMMVDQAYWQSAIAAKATAAVGGYFLGAWMYLGIIFTLPLGLGVLALALDLPLSTNEALEGLVMPASAYVLLGKGGAVLVIVMIFMAVTSSGASEMLAVSSLFTFDIYRRYIKPKANGAHLVTVSRVAVLVWAIIMGIAMCIAQVANINVNWLVLLIGVCCGGAVIPLATLLFWRKATGLAACIAAPFGLVCGMASWLGVSQAQSGSISIDSTGLNNPLLAGNMCSIFGSGLMLILVTYIKPNKIPFDWEDFKTKITTSDEHVKKAGALDASSVEDAAEMESVARIRKPTWIAVGVIIFSGFIVWPLLTLPADVFSLAYFRFYVILGFFILISASIVGISMPLWEARHLFFKVVTGSSFQEWKEKSNRGGSLRGGNAYNGSVKDPDLKPAAPTTGKPVSVDDSAHNGDATPAAKV